MSWSVVSMLSGDPIETKAAGTTLSPAIGANNVLEVDDIVAVGIAYDNTTASAPNITWTGGFTQSGSGLAIATPPAYIHSNSPQSASGGGVRTAIMLARVTAAGTLTGLTNITFSASITAKVTAVVRIRGGGPLALSNIVSRGDFAVSGGAFPARSLTNPSGSGDYLVLNAAGMEGNSIPSGGGNGVLTSGTNLTGATSGGSAVTNIGLAFGWQIGNATGINYGGGTASADVSASLVMFGNSYVPPPVAPTARTLSAPSVGAGKVTLAWDVDLVAFPSPVYDVEYSTDQSNWTRAFTDLSSSSGVAVTGLTNDVLYYFRVRGGNSAGEAPWSNIVSGTPVAFLKRHNFETGADGVDISFDNAPGAAGVADAFDYILNSGTSPPKYSSAQKYNGSLSGFFSQAGVYNESVVGWNFGANAMDIWYARFYLYITGAPGAETKLVQVGAPGDNPLFSLNLTIGGRLRIDSSGGTTSSILPFNQWVRVELMNAYADETQARLYLDPAADVSSPDSEFGKFIGGLDQIGTAKFGVMTSSGAAYMDDIAMGENGGWIGPSSAPPPATVNAGQFGMIPIF